MRILHVIPFLSPRRGGPSFAVRTMAEGIARSGASVHVVATDDDDGKAHLEVPLGLPIEERGVTYRYFRRQTRVYSFSWPLTLWLREHVRSYDLIHIHGLFSYINLPASLMARRHRVPYIVRPFGTLNRWGIENRRPQLKQLSLRAIERPMLAGAALIHYTTEQERLEAEALGVRYPSAVLPIGIDLSAFETLPSPDAIYRRFPTLAGQLTVLFLSRLHPKKGLDLLLPAFAQAAQQLPQLRLLIVGEGEEPFVDGLKLLSDQLGIADRVVWAGFLSGEEKQAALAAADLFVLPSYSENFGIAAVEALAAGVPVILSDQVAIHHEVSAGGGGLVVPCTVEALSTALHELASDDARRGQLAQQARLVAHDRYSLPIMTTRLLSLYQQVIQSARDE